MLHTTTPGRQLTSMEPLPPAPHPKPKRKSKTLWGIAASTVGIILMATGASDANVDFLADGFQIAEDLGPLLTAVGTIVAGIGLRLAKRPVA